MMSFSFLWKDGILFEYIENMDADAFMDKIEEYLIIGMKYSFGLLVLGQTVMGIMGLLS